MGRVQGLLKGGKGGGGKDEHSVIGRAEGAAVVHSKRSSNNQSLVKRDWGQPTGALGGRGCRNSKGAAARAGKASVLWCMGTTCEAGRKRGHAHARRGVSNIVHGKFIFKN